MVNLRAMLSNYNIIMFIRLKEVRPCIFNWLCGPTNGRKTALNEYDIILKINIYYILLLLNSVHTDAHVAMHVLQR